MKRRSLPKNAEAEVLIQSLRHCCLCFFHSQIKSVRRGQIAHLNRNPNDHAVENLIWLCLDHHAEYDSRSNQFKGWTINEVRYWRDRMYEELEESRIPAQSYSLDRVTSEDMSDRLSDGAVEKHTNSDRPWRFPLWQIADRPEFFAYAAKNRADGVCVIERVDLPDGRVVIACIQVPGNPGNSITNTVETICEQVCGRFDISLENVVWLENYEYIDSEGWNRVVFDTIAPDGGVGDPRWEPMSTKDWEDLKLRPRPRLGSEHGDLISKLEKLFPWPPVDYKLG